MFLKSVLATVIILTGLIKPTAIFAEIETVVISWAPGLCLESCRRELDRRLSRMSQVAEVSIPSGSDTATLRWKPKSRFSFEDLNFAVRGVGLRIDSLIVKVRGYITHDSRTVFLNSLEDGTVFTLLGRIDVEPNMAPVPNSPYTHELSSSLRERLLQAETDYKVVTIVGPIFQPNRGNSNLPLVVQSMSETPSLR